MSFLKPFEGEVSADGRRVRVKMDAGKRSLYFNGGLVLLVGLGAAAYWGDPDFDNTAATLPWLLPAMLIAAGGIYVSKFRPYEWALTPEGERHKAAGSSGLAKYDKQIDAAIEKALSVWYLRYPVAAIIGWLIYAHLSQDFPDGWQWEQWAVLIGPGLIVLWCAREVAALVLGIGLVIFLWNRIANAELSIPGAIIIGAVIIAYAIHSSRK